jgi:hypothetical protein
MKIMGLVESLELQKKRLAMKCDHLSYNVVPRIIHFHFISNAFFRPYSFNAFYKLSILVIVVVNTEFTKFVIPVRHIRHDQQNLGKFS